jgi:hypothetical protein
MPGTPRDIPYLESKFETGDIPTQQDFYDLFASFVHYLKIKNTTGSSTTDVMSQKAVTDALAALSAADLASVLTTGNDAGAQQIKNLADPTSAQDADTQAARDAAIAALETLIKDGVVSAGDSLYKLYNLILTKEDSANKETGSAPTDNTTKYPSSHTVYTALLTKQDSLGYTAENVANKATSLASNDNTHYPTTAATKSADDAVLANAQAYTDSAIAGTFSYRGTYDGSSGNYPSTGGRGPSGVPRQGDAYEILAACTIQGTDYDQGDIIVGKALLPGNTGSDWGASEHNTQQATTSMRGTAMVVDTITIQNNATTDDQKMVTAAKFWSGIATLKGQTNTWALAQTFTTAPVLSSVSASQYLKVDSGKAVTSVASIPDSDISYANKNANLVFAGPSSGAAAAPAFRALVTNDLTDSLVTYAKIQNVSDGRILGNATGGAAAPSEISVENGMALSASKIKWGGALTAATAISSTGIVNPLSFSGSFTTTASGQYFSQFNPTVTLRATASDVYTSMQMSNSIAFGAATQTVLGLDLSNTYNLTGGISAMHLQAAPGGLVGMVAGTYNNVAPVSTSGAGTGALFTVIVANSTTFTSFTATTPGSGYKTTDTVTFNASQFGGSSGSTAQFIRTVTGVSLNTNSSVLRLGTTGVHWDDLPRFIDFYWQGASQGYIGLGSNPAATATGIAIFDGTSQSVVFTNANGAVFSKAILANSTLLVTGAATFNNAVTLSGAVSFTNQPTTSLPAAYANVAWIRSNSANNKYATFSNKSTVIAVGVINTYTVGGTATNGTYTNVTLTGGTGSGAIANSITVSGGVVTAMTLTGNNKGINYSNGDVLTGTITGGSATLTVTSIDFTGNYYNSFLDEGAITESKSINNYVSFNAAPTYNITSTQVGAIYGFLFNPTLTGTGSFNVYGIVVAPSSAKNGFGVSAPTATVEIAAQTSSRAALKLNSGTVLSSTVGGAIEYNNLFYITKNSGLRVGIGGSLFENYTDAGSVGTGETDLYSYTTPANSLEANGGRFKATYGFNLVNSASTKQVKIYFAGTAIFDSGALTVTAAANLTIDITIIRVSSTVVRYIINGSGKNTSTSSFSETGELTGLTLSNTNILKATGTAAGGAAANNDIVAKAADGYWLPVSQN